MKDIYEEESVHNVLEKALNEEFTDTMIEHKIHEEEMINTLDKGNQSDESDIGFENIYSFEPVKDVAVETQTLASDGGKCKWLLKFYIVMLVVGAITVPAVLLASGKMMVPETKSFYFLSRKSHGLEGQRNVPVLLDITGTSPLSTILSKCFNLKSNKDIPLQADLDFYVVNSLCDMPKQIKSNDKFRIFFLMENPLQESYSKMKKPTNVKDTKFGLNTLTRSIVCKAQGKLTDRDLEKARKIMREKSDVELFYYFTEGIKMFQEKYNWKSTANSDKCINLTFQAKSLNKVNVLSGEGNFNFEESFKTNYYDVKLYMDYVNSKVNLRD